MKKLLLSVITLLGMAAAAFAVDEKDVSKKFETFYKSGTYIKTIDTVEGDIRYYFKQHLTRFNVTDKNIRIYTDDGNCDIYYDGEDEWEYITNVYLQDGNLIIEWHED